MLLEGKVAVVTGGTRGIGFEIVRKYLANGAKVVLFGSRSETVDKALAKLKEENPAWEAEGMYPRLTDAAEVEKSILSVKEKFGKIDILVNNAGISHIGLLADMSLEEWNRIIQTNLTSVFCCCRRAIPSMVRIQSGRILNISSVWGKAGASMEVAYSASKGGVNSFTKALARELSPSNIQVNGIAFGVIDTEMNACFSAEELRLLEEEIPAGRMGSVREAGELIRLIIGAPAYLTGQILTMDGGWIG